MNEAEAFKRGQDYAKNGANTHNCSFEVFATPQSLKAWEKGRDSIKNPEKVYLSNKVKKQ